MSNNPFLYTNRDMTLGQRTVRGMKDVGHNAGRSIVNAVVMAPWKLVNQIFNPNHPIEWIKSRHEQRMEKRFDNGLGRTLGDFQALQQHSPVKENDATPIGDVVLDAITTQTALQFADAVHQQHLALIEDFQKQSDAGHQQFMGEVAGIEAELDDLTEQVDAVDADFQKQVNEVQTQFGNQLADVKKQLDAEINNVAKEMAALTFISAKIPPGTTRAYLASAYQNGFPRLVEQGATELNGSLITQLRHILEKCQDGSPEAELIFSDLSNGFIACQATQQRTVAEVYKKIQDGQYEGKSFVSVLGIPFKNLNGHVLDRTIEALYPKSVDASDATPYLQFEHVKMGFLAVLGGHFGLGDATMLGIAESDPHRYKPSAAEVNQFKQEFTERLRKEQVKFLTDMANQLNNPAAGTSKPGSAYSLWVDDPAHPSRAAKFRDCFYEDEYRDYPGLNAPTSDQEDMTDFYFSPKDVITMLDEMGGLDSTAKERLQVFVDLTKEKKTSAPVAVSPVAVVNSKESKEALIKDSLAALVLELEKDKKSFRMLKTEGGITYSVGFKKEGAKTIVTIQDSEGYDTSGFAGVWCSLMLPDNTLRINKQDIKNFNDPEKLESVLKAIELFKA